MFDDGTTAANPHYQKAGDLKIQHSPSTTKMLPTNRSIPSYAQPIKGFQADKASQLSAYFIVLAGGHIEKLKLIKLIYLTERRFLERYSEPILWDEFFSLPHGPICSATLNCVDGVIYEELTQQFFIKRGNRNVHAIKRFSRDDFTALSDGEIETAIEVWQEHGGKSASQIRNYTHTYCKEYTELDSGRMPISYEDLLAAVGLEDSAAIAADILAYRELLSQSSA